MADSTPKSYHLDPSLYLYTSLSSGSSTIITATSRMETILKAKRIPFTALDIATDEKARMLWGRRAGKRKLPGLVKRGMIVGDIEEVEEWNEYGELMDHLGDDRGMGRGEPASMMNTPSKAPLQAQSTEGTATTREPPPTPAGDIDNTKQASSEAQLPSTPPSSTAKPPQEKTLTSAMQSIGYEAAQKAKDAKSSRLKNPVTTTSSSTSKEPSTAGITDVEADESAITSSTTDAAPPDVPLTERQPPPLPKEVSAAAEKAMAQSAGEAVSEAAPVEQGGSSIEDMTTPGKKEEMTSIAQTRQQQGDEAEGQSVGKTAKVAMADDDAEVPEGRTRTQEQPAGKAEAAGESVGD